VGAENPFTAGDLGILVDQPADSIQPRDPDAGWWNGQGVAPSGGAWPVSEFAIEIPE